MDGDKPLAVTEFTAILDPVAGDTTERLSHRERSLGAQEEALLRQAGAAQHARTLRRQVQPQGLTEQRPLVRSRVACLARGPAAARIKPESLSNCLHDGGLTRAVVTYQERQRADELQTAVGQLCHRGHGERPNRLTGSQRLRYVRS